MEITENQEKRVLWVLPNASWGNRILQQAIQTLPVPWSSLLMKRSGEFQPWSRPAKKSEVVRRRWWVEVIFHEVRAHLGVETQRQWSDAAITRTTLTLLSLFSLVTLLAHRSARQQTLPIRQAAW